MVGPATGFKLTLEMLRRKPDSALVWYEDFRDEEKIPESYWTVLSGEWDVWQDPDSTANRPYSQLEGYGQLAWNYDGFSDIHLRAQIIIPPDGGGKSGIFLGSLFLCINYDTQRLELYEGSTLKGSYAATYRHEIGQPLCQKHGGQSGDHPQAQGKRRGVLFREGGHLYL